MHGLDTIIIRNARQAGRECARAGSDLRTQIMLVHEDEVERLPRGRALVVDGAFLEAYFNEPA